MELTRAFVVERCWMRYKRSGESSLLKHLPPSSLHPILHWLRLSDSLCMDLSMETCPRSKCGGHCGMDSKSYLFSLPAVTDYVHDYSRFVDRLCRLFDADDRAAHITRPLVKIKSPRTHTARPITFE